MYKHILIPTDGSELSRKAIEHGIALAKSVNAKVTAVTVTVPFHVFSIEPGMVTNTPGKYEKYATDMAAKDLNVAKEAAKANGISCDTIRVGHESLYLGSETAKVLTHRGFQSLSFARHRRPSPSAAALRRATRN